jgi:Tfp pilus assembly protein PilO
MKKFDLSILNNKQTKELISFIILGIIILIIDFSFVLTKQLSQVSALKPALIETRKKVVESSGEVFRLDSFKKRLAELNTIVSKEKLGIVNEENIPNLLTEISRMADAEKLKIMQIRPHKEIRSDEKPNPAAKTRFYSLPISVIAQGEYHALGKFINKLENSTIFIKVNTLDIMSQAEGSKELDIKLLISIFVVENI